MNRLESAHRADSNEMADTGSAYGGSYEDAELIDPVEAQAHVPSRRPLGAHEAARMMAAPEPPPADPLDADMPTVRCVPRDETADWDQYPHDQYWPDDPVTDPHFDFWAHYAQSKQQNINNKAYEKIVNYQIENYGRVPPFAFCREMQRLYNKHARPFLTDPSETDPRKARRMVDPVTGRPGGPPWPARMIYEYARREALVPSAMRLEIARTFQEACYCLQNNQIFLIDSATPNQKKVDYKALDMFMKAAKEARYWIDKVEAARTNKLVSL